MPQMDFYPVQIPKDLNRIEKENFAATIATLCALKKEYFEKASTMIRQLYRESIGSM